jgi:rhamnosyltransferase
LTKFLERLLSDNIDKAGHFFEDLLVVLVIYKMRINESPAFRSLTRALRFSSQSATLFIYDNSLHPQLYEQRQNCKINYRHDPTNPGVSKAYNEGFVFAKSENKKWMLLVDQDTEFKKDVLLKYKIAIEENNGEQIFVPVLKDTNGIVSPFLFHFGLGMRLKEVEPRRYQLSQKKFINSGLLVAVDLFGKAGGFDEQLKLDFSDLAFIQRLNARAQSFSVIDSCGVHSLSSAESRSVHETLHRFRLYCKASNNFGKLVGKFWPMLWRYCRAGFLGLKYLDGRFLVMVFNE